MGERRKMERGCKRAVLADQVGILLMMHFPQADPTDKEDPFSDLRCEDCADLHEGFCQGEGRKGWKVVKCMESKARNGEVGFVMDEATMIQ